MEIASIIDQELAEPHGNRKGLSYGQLVVLFLTYVVSQTRAFLGRVKLSVRVPLRIRDSAGSHRRVARQSDHRLCAVEPWVEKHRQTLEIATGWNIGVKDATDR